jgi:RimJ/RimL family protein N-acetyltransferase
MIPYSTLSNSRVTLRPLHFDDSTELYSAIHESLADLKPWMSWAHDGYSREEARDYIAITRARWGDGTMFAFAITDANSGALLGACSLSHIHPVYFYCNLGYWIRTSQRGRGVAGEAARLAARFAFEKVKLIRVEVVVAVENEASMKVAEKIGVHREGILRNRIVVRKNIYNAVMFSFVPQDFNLQATIMRA